MSNIRAVIRAELIKDTAIAGKIADGSKYHIYPLQIPIDKISKGNYFITYQQISNRKDVRLELNRVLMQINAVATSYEKAVDLTEDILNVLERAKGTIGSQTVNREIQRASSENELDFYDDKTKLWYIPIDFRFIFLGDNI